mgnify:CR=1 FL=1
MLKTAEVKRKWHVVDAKDIVLGKVATDIAKKLMGKEKITFTPHIDDGDFVVVINSSLVHVTGRKDERKKYYNHSSFPGGIRERSFAELQKGKPSEAIERAVHNMLPKNKLRADRMARLKVYPTTEHPHQSQIGK